MKSLRQVWAAAQRILHHIIQKSQNRTGAEGDAFGSEVMKTLFLNQRCKLWMNPIRSFVLYTALQSG